MALNAGDHVRLTRRIDRIPKGTNGVVDSVEGSAAAGGKVAVTFAGFGKHHVPEDAVERMPNPGEPGYTR